MNKKKKWTDDEIDILNKNYVNNGLNYIHNLMPYRTKTSINLKAMLMGLTINTKWNKKDTNYLIKNYAITPTEVLANKINRTIDSVRIKALRLKLHKPIDPPLTNKDKQFIKNNYTEYGARYCSNKLNKKYGQITRFVQKNNLCGIRLHNRKKHSHDYDYDVNRYLIIKDKYIAYLYGFIWADGHIPKNGSKSTIITICKKDYDNELKKIIDEIDGWKIYKAKNREVYYLHLHNVLVYNFLSENDFKIKSGVSPEKILSKIPEKLHEYFFRGFMDGDGSYKSDIKSGYAFNATSCYDQDWNFMIDLAKKLNIKYKIIHRIQNNGSSSTFNSYNKKDLISFFNFIYKIKDVNEIGYKRKYNIMIKALDLK